MKMLTPEDIAKLEELLLPVNDWLHDNGTPHDTLIVSQGAYEVVEGVCVGKLPVRD